VPSYAERFNNVEEILKEKAKKLPTLKEKKKKRRMKDTKDN